MTFLFNYASRFKRILYIKDTCTFCDSSVLTEIFTLLAITYNYVTEQHPINTNEM